MEDTLNKKIIARSEVFIKAQVLIGFGTMLRLWYSYGMHNQIRFIWDREMSLSSKIFLLLLLLLLLSIILNATNIKQ